MKLSKNKLARIRVDWDFLGSFLVGGVETFRGSDLPPSLKVLSVYVDPNCHRIVECICEGRGPGFYRVHAGEVVPVRSVRFYAFYPPQVAPHYNLFHLLTWYWT